MDFSLNSPVDIQAPMIQRIQSIMLLLAGASLVGLFFLPFATTEQPQAEGIFSDAVYNLSDEVILVVLTILGIALAVVTIGLFKNRPAQIRLGYIGAAICAAIPAAAILLMPGETAQDVAMSNVQSSFAAGIFVPAAALIFFVLASYFTKKDEKLVRSMDRLR